MSDGEMIQLVYLRHFSIKWGHFLWLFEAFLYTTLKETILKEKYFILRFKRSPLLAIEAKSFLTELSHLQVYSFLSTPGQ